MRNEDVAAVPLFDRLVDAERWTPREARPYRTLDRASIRLSIATEVERLLNTRCTLTVDQAVSIDPKDRTVLDYGIPDFSNMNPLGDTDAALLGTALRNSLLAFEPRLADPQVQVIGLDSRQRSVLLAISGILRLGRTDEPFAFAVSVDQASQAPVGESNAA